MSKQIETKLEDKSEKELLIEILENTKTMNKSLKWVKWNFIFDKVTTLIFWILIIVSTYFGIKLISPMVGEIQNKVIDLQSTFNQLGNTTTQLQDIDQKTLDSLKNIKK